MAVLQDRVLEKKALRLITAGEPTSAWLLGSLGPGAFNSAPAREALARINQLAKVNSDIIQWDDLLHDPALSQQTRDALALYKKRPVTDKASAKAILNRLEDYRKLREIYKTIETATEALQKDSVDVDKIAEALGDGAARARTKGDILKTYNLGVGNNSAGIVKRLLAGTALTAIPTGFKTFDKINRGLFKGSLVVMGGSTGGGKTAMALQLMQNFADSGAKVNLTSLEMTEEETFARRLSRLSGVSMTKIINPAALTPREKKKIIAAYSQRVKDNKMRGATEAISVASEDISIEELLFSLRPKKYDVIIVDYITLLKDTDGDDQWRKLGQVARFCKVFAKNNDCIIILLVQVSPDGVVRYSRTVAEHANNAWVWVRDQRSKDTHILAIQQIKARNQRDFPFELYENFDTMTISDLPEDYHKQLEAAGFGHNSGASPPGAKGKPTKTNVRGGGNEPKFTKQVIDDEDSYFGNDDDESEE